jgi:adenosylcobinamide kinase/adenosylcobinamide-phosphate guanylyltransferase
MYSEYSPTGYWDPESTSRLYQRIKVKLSQLIETAASRHLTLIVVSSEVGLGLVATISEGRAFTDLLGRTNQDLTASAKRVLLAIAGLACELKSMPGPGGEAPACEEVPR